jgi:hypothetical protein
MVEADFDRLAGKVRKSSLLRVISDRPAVIPANARIQ